MMDKEILESSFAKVYENAKFKDRGNKKWNAMMLPEHLVELRQDEVNYGKLPRPQLDQYDLEYIQDEIQVDGEIKFRGGTIGRGEFVETLFRSRRSL